MKMRTGSDFDLTNNSDTIGVYSMRWNVVIGSDFDLTNNSDTGIDHIYTIYDIHAMIRQVGVNSILKEIDAEEIENYLRKLKLEKIYKNL